MFKTIKVTLKMPGAHRFADVKTHYPLNPEIHYLGDLHRHTFSFDVEMFVQHNERDIEFILFQNQIKKYLMEEFWSTEMQLLLFEGMSCESIAEQLANHFDAAAVTVGEDGEFFSTIYKVDKL